MTANRGQENEKKMRGEDKFNIFGLPFDAFSYILTFLPIGEAMLLSMASKTLQKTITEIVRETKPITLTHPWTISKALRLRHKLCLRIAPKLVRLLKHFAETGNQLSQLSTSLEIVTQECKHEEIISVDALVSLFALKTSQDTITVPTSYMLYNLDKCNFAGEQFPITFGHQVRHLHLPNLLPLNNRDLILLVQNLINLESLTISMDFSDEYEEKEHSIEYFVATETTTVQQLLQKTYASYTEECYIESTEQIDLYTKNGTYSKCTGPDQIVDKGQKIVVKRHITHPGYNRSARLVLPMFNQLKKLDIQLYYDVFDPFIAQMLQSSPQLEELRYKSNDEEPNLEDGFLYYIYTYGTQIKKLTLGGNRSIRVTDQGILMLLSKMELEELHLSECLLIDGSFLETVSQHAQSLQKLSIEAIGDDTDELEFVVQGCMPNLHSFSLIAQFPLSEQFIDSFVSAVPHLKSLKLGEDSDVSFLLALLEKCPLEEIDIDVSFEDVDKSLFVQAL